VLEDVYVTCEAHGDVFVLDQENGGELAHFQVRGRPRSVAFLPDGLHAYIPAEGEAEVSAVDTVLKKVAQTIRIEGADVRPMGAVPSWDGHEVYVSTGQGNLVAVINADKNAVDATIKVGGRPWGIALGPDGHTLYTANGNSNDVSVVDVQARKEIGRVKAGDGPWGLVVGPKLP
jgi:YVTN family beta-propeller protein